jgi:hypothetical protein
METLTGYRTKIVERAGVNLERTLHQSNPWEGKDPQRKGCLCASARQKKERTLSRVATR